MANSGSGTGNIKDKPGLSCLSHSKGIIKAAKSVLPVCESCSVVSYSLWLHGLYSPWNSPGQNTGVGSHFILQGILTNPGRDPRSPTLQVDSLPAEPPGKPKNTGVDSLSLLQRIFSTQESNRGRLHCRWILYQLSYQGSCIAFRKSSVNTWNAPRLRVNKTLPRWRVARGVAFPSFRILTYSTKVSGATSLGTSTAHQDVFLFFFLEVEDPLTVRWGLTTNSSQWAMNRGDECHFQPNA